MSTVSGIATFTIFNHVVTPHTTPTDVLERHQDAGAAAIAELVLVACPRYEVGRASAAAERRAPVGGVVDAHAHLYASQQDPAATRRERLRDDG